VVMLPLLALTIATVIHLRRVARETGSLVIKADALHYMTDVYVNVGVLVALSLVWLTHEPIFDTIISVGIALYMVISSLKIVSEGFGVVMDKSLDKEPVAKLSALLGACSKIESFHDFKTRAGKVPHVDFHVVVRPEMTAVELHDLYIELRDQIRGVVGTSTRVLMHADPVGHPEGSTMES
ncbi:MAG: cation diffusion facilitator family transporter, partial [Proteobacteria bacterium]|nr:cation diffusion facilitator family transporter [Pseudomonadota bacterium]